MCCFLAVLVLLGPRAAILIWWLIDPIRWKIAYSSFFIPFLGFIFAPWTTMGYVLVAPGGVEFFDWVILGATLILYAISHDLRTTIKRMSEKVVVSLSATGVFIYAITGALCLVLGVNYLDYSGLAAILGVDPVSARSHGILIVEIGVGIAVMAVMVSLYYNLSSVGKQDEGL